MNGPTPAKKPDVRVYRLIYFLMLTGILGENLFVKLPDKYNLVITEGNIVVGIGFLILLLSFVWPLIRKQFQPVHLSFSLLVSAWVLHFAYINGFGVFDIITFLIIIPLFNLTLQKQRLLLVYNLGFYTMFLTALILVPGQTFVKGSLTKYDLLLATSFFTGLMYFVSRARLAAVDALTKSKESFETIFQHSTDALFILDPDTLSIKDYNQEATSMFHVADPGKIIGTSFLHYFKKPADADAITAAAIHKEMASNHQWKIDSRFGMFDDTIVWGEIAIRPVTVDNRETWLARVVDIGRRKILEEELERKVQERTEFISQVLNNNPSLIYVKDWEGKYTLVNQAMADLYGTTTQDFLGKTDLDFIGSPESMQASLKEDQEVMQTLQPRFLPEVHLQMQKVGENRFGKKTEQRWFQVVKVPLVSGDLKTRHLLGVATDITARKKAELRSKELDELKNRFIKIVSHQMRTPLAAIGWNLELILGGDMGPLTSEQSQALTQAHESNQEIITRIGDLILALDIEEGKATLDKKPVALGTLLAKVLKPMKPRLSLKEIKLKLDAPAAIPAVQADPDKIQAVIKVLLDNALAYTPEGGAIGIRIAREGIGLHFEVKDSGIGIPEAEQSQLFDRFFRATNAFTMVQDSSGLGLFIAKHFVEAHGGKLGFTSALGKGSTFWFELPMWG